jgi:hypothetical protein
MFRQNGRQWQNINIIFYVPIEEYGSVRACKCCGHVIGPLTSARPLLWKLSNQEIKNCNVKMQGHSSLVKIA